MTMTSEDSAFRELGEALSEFEMGTTSRIQPPRPPPRRHPRSWEGCLKDMPTLPLDLLFEILRRLKPLDILFLARATRDFRALLMSKTSASFWIAARRNIYGLPNCPSFLSEPEYANLVFDHGCHCCSRGKSRFIVWEYRARYCRKCIDRMTTKENAVQLPEELDYHKLFSVAKASPSHTKHDKRVHTPDLEKFLRAWESTDPALRSEFLSSQGTLRERITEFARECEVWVVESKKAAAAYRIEMHRVRLERVVNKLRDLGWGDELALMADSEYMPLSNLNFVRLTAPWDESTWEEVKEKVITLMEAEKSKRLRSERVILLQERLTYMVLIVLFFRREFGNRLFPWDCDFAAIPEVQEIIDVPDEVEVTPHSFMCLRPKIPGFVANWHQERLQQLEESLREHIDSPLSTPLTELAVSQFYVCRYCRQLFDISTMLAHNCPKSPLHRKHSSAYNEAADRVTVSRVGISVEPKIDILKGILEACGQDYLRCTVEDMDNLDVRLSCRPCNNRSYDRHAAPCQEVMNWRGAVQHVYYNWLYDTDPCTWEIIRDELPVIKRLEAAAAFLDIQNTAKTCNWICGDCFWVRYRSKDEICYHIRTDHGVHNPVEHSDLFFNLRVPVVPHHAVYLISNRVSIDELSSDHQHLLQNGLAALVPLE